MASFEFKLYRKAVLSCLLSLGSFAGAQQYHIIDLGSLNTSGTGIAYAINNAGQIAGYSISSFGSPHAFIYSGGTMTDLDTLGSHQSYGMAISGNGVVSGTYIAPANGHLHGFTNDGTGFHAIGTLGGTESHAFGSNSAGHVVGDAYTSSGDDHAFLYNGTSIIDLGVLALTQSGAFGINSSDMVVGKSSTAGGSTHAFLYSGGAMSDLGTLGGSTSIAYAINDAGTITGAANVASGTDHAFVYAGGSMSDLGVLTGGTTSNAFAINTSGQIVGQSNVTGGATHAFLYSNGAMADLNAISDAGTQHITLRFAYGINDSGTIVGQTLDGHAYMAVTPEPATILVLGAPLLSLLRRRKRAIQPPGS